MTTVEFAYKVRDAQGAIQEGTLEAESRDAAQAALRRDGCEIIVLENEDDIGGLIPRRVKKQEVIYTTSQLAIMVETGINLSAALDGLREQTDNPTWRRVLSELRASVEAGQDFSAALAQFPRYFDRTYIALVKASERTGSLGTMLEQIANHLSKEQDHRRKVRGALAYPGFMLILAINVTIFLLTYVMPKFEPLFKRKGVKLPTPTRYVIAASESLIHYWWAWVALAVAIIAGIVIARRTKQGQCFFDWLKLNLPILGPTARKLILSRSIRTLGVMVRSGVPILDSIRLSAEVSCNYFYERSWQHVINEITRGRRIAEALRGDPLFPKTLIQMIGSGEETGKLDYVLEKVSNHYDKEVEIALKTTTSLIEPLMITVMGSVIGGIGMSVMLPIFTLSRAG